MDDARTPVTVLALLASSADREALRAIIGHSKWKLRFEERLGDVRQVLNGEDVGVILSDCTLPDGHSWKDLLRAVEETPPARPLIVTDRLADERLWGEVLNLGAYDLLAQPFHSKEVFQVISLAWQSWRSRSNGLMLLDVRRRRPAARCRCHMPRRGENRAHEERGWS
jgi:DNA-binding NtrC family response regulator